VVNGDASRKMGANGAGVKRISEAPLSS